MAEFFKAQPHIASFALKEGSSIKTNKLDYSLMFLHTSPREMLMAPLEPEKKKLRSIPLFFKLQSPILSNNAPTQAIPTTIVSK